MVVLSGESGCGWSKRSMALFKWFSTNFNLRVLFHCGCIAGGGDCNILAAGAWWWIVVLQNCVVRRYLLHQFIFFSSNSWWGGVAVHDGVSC
uniref:Uncharacterized protein n=1 Tax=Physcomitrium patens TaxID=3218 RepID=A0A2K1KTF0_PHYPA|nr:hypothetical protein PHYPA_004032 [Physcomitrium patens]